MFHAVATSATFLIHPAHPAHAWESPAVGPGRRDALGQDISLHVYSAAADGSLGSHD